MSSSTQATDPSEGLTIVKYLIDRRGYPKALVRRESDGEMLLGETMEGGGKPEAVSMMMGSSYGTVLQNLLNHENLVSIAGFVSATDDPWSGGGGGIQTRYMLWDYCDAGTLEMLLREPPVLPRADGQFLPASLCWHVVLSLLRALTWLHHGYREDEVAYMVERADGDVRFGNNKECRVKRETRAFVADPDWMPMLHRAITPENVFFQQPRGIETYGLCKLGNYSNVHISGHVSDRSTEGVVVAPAKGDAPVLAMGNALVLGRKNILKMPKDKRPYTRGSDLFAVGALLFRMMTCTDLPDPDECPDCGCLHLDLDATKCAHGCREAVDVRKGPELFAGLEEYAGGLDAVVGDLLRHHRSTTCPPTWEVLKIAEHQFARWRRTSADGRLFVPLEQDLHRRWDAVYARADQRLQEGPPLQMGI